MIGKEILTFPLWQWIVQTQFCLFLPQNWCSEYMFPEKRKFYFKNLIKLFLCKLSSDLFVWDWDERSWIMKCEDKNKEIYNQILWLSYSVVYWSFITGVRQSVSWSETWFYLRVKVGLDGKIKLTSTTETCLSSLRILAETSQEEDKDNFLKTPLATNTHYWHFR